MCIERAFIQITDTCIERLMNCVVATKEIRLFKLKATMAPISPNPNVQDSVHAAEARMMRPVRTMFSLSLLVMMSIEPDHEISENT